MEYLIKFWNACLNYDYIGWVIGSILTGILGFFYWLYSYLKNRKQIISTDEIKKNVKILFVDDYKFPHTEILKNQFGWTNTKRIKDITGYKDKDLMEADIVFIDINGVAKKLFPNDEGLGLAAYIKKNMKKVVIIYSDNPPSKNFFHEAMKLVDDIIDKGSDPISFDSKIKEQAYKIYGFECS